MNRRAFSIVEVLLYVLIMVMMVPLVIQSVALVNALRKQGHVVTAQSLYHRTAFNQLLYDVVRAISWQVSEHGVTLEGVTYNAAWQPLPWRVRYELRKRGVYRVQERTVKGNLVKSSTYLAPPINSITIESCGNGWVRVRYKQQSGGVWEQTMYCWVQL